MNTPSEVVQLALAYGVDVIALTDHDTVGGVVEAQQAAAQQAAAQQAGAQLAGGLDVIAGVEINAEGSWGDLHFLGYYVDVEHDFLLECLARMRNARVDRAKEMLARLRSLGMRLDWEDIETVAKGDSIGRPHVARALCDRGYVRTIQDAFERFIGRDGPAYVPRLRLTPRQAIEAILKAGGVPVLAHPAHSGKSATSLIPEFVTYGLRGIEVYYPHHNPEDVAFLLSMCQKHGLLATGGSDYHGPSVRAGISLGSVDVPFTCFEALREAVRSGA